MSSRAACWLNGHRWGAWDDRGWSNLLGWRYRVRWCEQCGAMQRRDV